MESAWVFFLLLWTGGVQTSAQTVSASEDPNSVFCRSNPCQNNGTCVNMLRPGSDRSLAVCKRGVCYKLILQQKTWEEASLACNIMGASLASFETAVELQDFVNTIREHRLHRTQSSLDNPGGFWSSGNTHLTDDRWIWGRDQHRPVQVAFVPSHRPAANCLMLNTDLTRLSRMQLEAADCQGRLYYACRLTTEALYQERTFQCLCPEGYFGEFCQHTTDLQMNQWCSDSLLRLSCHHDRHLSVVGSTFHLDNSHVCPPSSVLPTGNCLFSASGINAYLREQIIVAGCEGQTHCVVNVTDEAIRDVDPCPTHPKYVKVQYRCLATYSLHTETCQSFTTELSCQKPLGLPHIRVNVAVYGRLRDSSVCSASTLNPGNSPVTNCRSLVTLDVVTRVCNGYSSCSVTASDDVFGDPCQGVFKYLVISYQCLANITEATAAYPLSYGVATLPPPVFCPAVNRSGIRWRATQGGKSDLQRCPDGQVGLASWHCDKSDPVGWSAAGPELSQCASPWISDIYKQIESGVSANVLAESVLNNTVSSSTVQNSDLQKTVSLMDDLLQLQDEQLMGLAEEEQETTVQAFGEILLEFGSNILAPDRRSVWESTATEDGSTTTSAVPTDVTANLEKTGFLVAQYLSRDKTNIVIQSENILMTVEAVAGENLGKPVYFQDTQKTGQGTSDARHTITLPPSATRTTGSNTSTVSAQVVFLVYETLGEYLTDTAIDGVHAISRSANDSDYDFSNDTDESLGLRLNSAVVSASARKQDRDVLTFENDEEVVLTMKHALLNVTGNVSCVFWNSSKSLGKTGAWSDKGCRLVSGNQTHSACACKHLTNFAILMDVTGTHSKIPEVHEKILTALTFVGCIISIACLFVSLFAFTFFKNIWSLRVTIHRNLCLMLLLANALFIAGVEQTQIKIVCSVIAGLLHYSFLSAFVWMSLEAVQFYIMLVHVFSTHSRHWPYYLAGYGIPAIVVGVSAGINYTGYGTDRYCWLSTDKYFIWSFTGPVAGIIAVNVVLLIVSLRIAYSSRSTVNKGIAQNDIRPWIKGAMTLLFLLGITWGIGFFFINQQSLVVAYIFTILNSLQGLFIFVFYCLGNERVNSELRKFVNRQKWLPVCLRDRYGRNSASNHSLSQKGTTINRRQTYRHEVYHKSDTSLMTTLSTLSEIEGDAAKAATDAYTKGTVDVNLVDESDEDNSSEPTKMAHGTTNMAYDTGSLPETRSTAAEGTHAADGGQGGRSWLHNGAANNATVAENKTATPIEYPDVDYD